MKQIVLSTLVLFVLALAGRATAQQAKVVVREGHFAPLSARITYRDGKSRDVVVVRSWYNMNLDSDPEFHGIGDGGSDVQLWLDTIARIKEVTDKEFTVVMKSGSERTLGYGPNHPGLVLQNLDGGAEFVQIQRIKSIDFVGAARKDSKGNVMFDQWKFSPFTGEKLPDLNR